MITFSGYSRNLPICENQILQIPSTRDMPVALPFPARTGRLPIPQRGHRNTRGRPGALTINGSSNVPEIQSDIFEKRFGLKKWYAPAVLSHLFKMDILWIFGLIPFIQFETKCRYSNRNKVHRF
jgi:hypothetical protein